VGTAFKADSLEHQKLEQKVPQLLPTPLMPIRTPKAKL
jgi:hypothetical protein